jgi:MoaA/NifB/PqqE/SkfB family radical SAM enzyme
VKSKRDLFVTLADRNNIQQAKQLFSSVYWNAGWNGDYMLLSHDIPEKELEWFTSKGILVKKCDPLPDKNLTKENYPLAFDIFCLFTPEFKKWKNIVFLNGDIIVRASLDSLTKIKGFACPKAFGDKLGTIFINETDTEQFSVLKKNYDLNVPAFNCGVMAFATEIITDDSYTKMIQLFETYQKVSTGSHSTLNQFFYKKWKRLPIVYGITPKKIENLTGMPSKNVRGVIIHLNHGELSLKNNTFYLEWKKNLMRAEEIDLKTIQKVKKWSLFKVQYHSLNIELKNKLHPFCSYIKNIPGRITKKYDLFLKKNKPGVFEKKKSERFPSSFIIQITDNCMARCHQCDNWKKKEPANLLTVEEKLRIIDEIHDLKGDSAYIHFGGGEPFLKKEELLTLAHRCMQKKINCGVDTTGYLIDEETAKKIAETKLNVQISLDSFTPFLHDEMRRLENCHQRSLMAVDNLIKHVGKDRVLTVTVVTKKNLDEIEKIIRFSNTKGIKSYFQPLMYTVVREPEYILKEYWPDKMEKIDETFRTIRNLKKQGVDCSLTNKKLSNYKKYFQTGVSQIKCNYTKNNLYFDCMGDVWLCFHSGVIGNIRKNSLKDIYYSEQAEKVKINMQNCDINCNIPVLQHFQNNRILKLKNFFYSTASAVLNKALKIPDRLLGKVGMRINKTSPKLYNKLKKVKSGR